MILYILLQKVTYGYLWILHLGIMLGACLHASFNQCRTQRDVSKFNHIKEKVINAPWSSCLPIIKNLKSTPEIKSAFEYLRLCCTNLSVKGFSAI